MVGPNLNSLNFWENWLFNIGIYCVIDLSDSIYLTVLTLHFGVLVEFLKLLCTLLCNCFFSTLLYHHIIDLS